MEKTRLSSKGQVIIPKSIRASRGWKPGEELLVEETNEGILLKPMRGFPSTMLRDVLGCMGYKGPPKSLRDMEEAIAKGAQERR